MGEVIELGRRGGMVLERLEVEYSEVRKPNTLMAYYRKPPQYCNNEKKI